MKLSKIYSLIWVIAGIALSVVDWRFGIIWVISMVLTDLNNFQRKREDRNKNKKIPTYIR